MPGALLKPLFGQPLHEVREYRIAPVLCAPPTPQRFTDSHGYYVIVAGAKAEMTIGVGPGLCGLPRTPPLGGWCIGLRWCFVAQYSSRWEASSRPFAGRRKEGHIMQSSEQEPVHVAPGEGAMRRVVGDLATFKMVGIPSRRGTEHSRMVVVITPVGLERFLRGGGGAGRGPLVLARGTAGRREARGGSPEVRHGDTAAPPPNNRPLELPLDVGVSPVCRARLPKTPLLGRWVNKGKKEASISVPRPSETERKGHRGCM
jgi:hypothetical protein